MDAFLPANHFERRDIRTASDGISSNRTFYNDRTKDKAQNGAGAGEYPPVPAEAFEQSHY